MLLTKLRNNDHKWKIELGRYKMFQEIKEFAMDVCTGRWMSRFPSL